MDTYFRKRWPVLNLFGFQVQLDASWLILALLVTWTLSLGYFPSQSRSLPTFAYWVMGVAAAAGLFISIILHELSHSLVARRFGVHIRGITLFIFGGISEMGGESPNPKAEFWIAAAGPAFSVAAGLVFLGIARLVFAWSGPGALVSVLNYLASLNFALAAFNLVPAFPLDGGRIFRAALWSYKKKRLWATHIASNVGMFIGTLLVLLGAIAVWYGNIGGGVWWGFLGFFVRSAAKRSYQDLLVLQILKEEPVGHLAHDGAIAVSPLEPLPHFISEFLYKHKGYVFPVLENSQLLGCIGMEQVQKIPKEQWAKLHVGDVIAPCSSKNSLSTDDNAADALLKMGEANSDRLLVTDHGRLMGTVSSSDIMDFFSMRLQLEGQTL